MNYIRKRISHPDIAEDILQDSFLKAVQSASSIRDEEKLIPWFYRIMHNTITDAYRRRPSEKDRAIRNAHHSDESVQPEDKNAICECIGDLLPAIQPKYAEIIGLLDLEEGSSVQVAERLGISRNNLKVRVHRAGRELRKRLLDTCRICAVHHCLDCTCHRDRQRGEDPV